MPLRVDIPIRVDMKGVVRVIRKGEGRPQAAVPPPPGAVMNGGGFAANPNGQPVNTGPTKGVENG